jgi:uncharacterized protein (DUF1786 family)
LDDLSAIAVAVFDHGNAPAGVSDRQFGSIIWMKESRSEELASQRLLIFPTIFPKS